MQSKPCLLLSAFVTFVCASCLTNSKNVDAPTTRSDNSSKSNILHLSYCSPVGKEKMCRIEIGAGSYAIPIELDLLKRDIVSASPRTVYLSVDKNLPPDSEQQIKDLAAFLTEIRSDFFVGRHRSSGTTYSKYGEFVPSDIRLESETNRENNRKGP